MHCSQRDLRVFTSANNVYWMQGSSTQPQQTANHAYEWKSHHRSLLRDQFVFAGVPLTQVLHANTNQPDMVSLQVSGSTSIFNTGPYNIEAFDAVCWDLPMTDLLSNGHRPRAPTGLSDHKMPFWTVPLRLAPMHENPSASSKSHWNLHGKDGLYNLLGSEDQDKKPLFPVWTNAIKNLDSKNPNSVKQLLSIWSNAQARYHSRVIGIALNKSKPGELMDVLLQRSMI